MKESFYFSHDYNSRNDSKIKRLILKHGYLGYGLFWAIIEDLYQNANALLLDYESIAFDLRTNEDIIKSIINDFDLFVCENNNFGSLSVQRRLEERNNKSLKARESARKRWNKSYSNANALQAQSDSNAIKERKGKENKEKEIINIDSRKLEFKQTLIPFLEKYGKDMLNDFYLHWTQVSKNGKLGFELEKTWSVEARLNTWSKRSFNNQQKPQQQENNSTTLPKSKLYEQR
jgi:hypothetical protein